MSYTLRWLRGSYASWTIHHGALVPGRAAGEGLRACIRHTGIWIWQRGSLRENWLKNPMFLARSACCGVLTKSLFRIKRHLMECCLTSNCCEFTALWSWFLNTNSALFCSYYPLIEIYKIQSFSLADVRHCEKLQGGPKNKQERGVSKPSDRCSFPALSLLAVPKRNFTYMLVRVPPLVSGSNVLRICCNFLCVLHHWSNCYKWMTLERHSNLPQNAVLVSPKHSSSAINK